MKLPQNPSGAWLMKYANAISPDNRKASGRVNNPSISSGPPTFSRSAANASETPPLMRKHLRSGFASLGQWCFWSAAGGATARVRTLTLSKSRP